MKSSCMNAWSQGQVDGIISSAMLLLDPVRPFTLLSEEQGSTGNAIMTCLIATEFIWVRPHVQDTTDSNPGLAAI